MVRWTVVFLVMVAVGCGSTASTGDAAVGPNDAGDDRTAQPDAPASQPPGTDIVFDSGVDACTTQELSSDGLASNCRPISSTCPTCDDGWLYECRTPGVGGQPMTPLSDPRLRCHVVSRLMDGETAVNQYCCEPGCVRQANVDGNCDVVKPHAYACAAGLTGLPATGAPAGCSQAPTVSSAAVNFCCD